MKTLMLLLPALMLPGIVQAADTGDTTEKYITSLCSLTSQEKKADSKEYYVEQIKTLTARGESPSSLNKSEFDEDEAEKVVSAWLSQSDEVKKANLHNPDGCKTATLDAYRKQN